MCVKLLIERHIECAQSSRESKGKLIRSMDCKLSDLGVMLSLFVELWFKFLNVGLFQSMSLCRIFNIEERRAEKEWFSKFTVFSNYNMYISRRKAKCEIPVGPTTKSRRRQKPANDI